MNWDWWGAEDPHGPRQRASWDKRKGIFLLPMPNSWFMIHGIIGVRAIVKSRVGFRDHENLDQVEKEDWIPALNPRYVAFRLIDREWWVRKSVTLVREDKIPPDRDLVTLPFIVSCDLDGLRRIERATGIDFTGRRGAP